MMFKKIILKRPLTHHLDGRLHEWAMATGMMMLGVLMLIYPKMSKGSIIQVLLQFVNSTIAALVFLFIGIFTVIALIANGSSLRIGPRIRSIMAISRSVLWAQFTLSMIKVSLEQEFPSPMVPFWLIFTLAEIYISYRAALDVRSH